jgi:hypothetical protein
VAHPTSAARILGLFLVVFVAACGSGSSGPDASGVGGTTGAAGGAAAGAGGGAAMDAGPPCNAVVNGAPFTTPADAPDGGASPPPATGGTIASGTYSLTSSTYYPSSSCLSPEPTAVTWVVTASSSTAGTFDLAYGTASSAFTETISYTTDGTTITTLLTCINPPVLTVGTTNMGPYSATPTTLTIYLLDAACGPHVDLYTKQ